MIEPACPRCGYDQSGAVAAWERGEPPQCPVSGVCSECGLGFLWRDLLNAEYREQARLFEHARRRRGRSFLMTLARAARPWSFWRWVRMEHTIVWGRLAGFVALAAFAMAAVAVALGLGLGWATYLILSQHPGGGYYSFDRVEALIELAWPLGRFYGRRFEASPHAIVIVLGVVLIPLAFATLPTTLRNARVRPAHILRVWLYGLVFIPVLLSMGTLVRLTGSILWTAWFVLREPRTSVWMPLFGMEEYQGLVGLGIAAIWLLLWWTWAVGRYLRLPRALTIGVAMTVMAFLGATIAVLLTPGMGARFVLGW